MLKGLCSFITILAFMAASLMTPSTANFSRSDEPVYSSFKVSRSGMPSFTWWEIKPSIPKVFYRLLTFQVLLQPVGRSFVTIYADDLTPAVIYLLTIQAARGPPALS